MLSLPTLDIYLVPAICSTLLLVLALEMKERVFPFSTSVQIPGAFVKLLRCLLYAYHASLDYKSHKDEEHFFSRKLKVDCSTHGYVPFLFP